MEKFLRLAPDLLVALLLWLLLLPRWRQRGARHAVMCTIFYLYLCGVAYFTLMPVLSALPEIGRHPYRPMHMEPFDDYLLGHRDAERQLVLNVVMMIPFGFLLPTLKRRGFWCCLGWTLVVTLSIELMQPLLSAARRSDITDVITNTLGGVVGYLLYLPLRRFLRPSE